MSWIQAGVTEGRDRCPSSLAGQTKALLWVLQTLLVTEDVPARLPRAVGCAPAHPSRSRPSPTLPPRLLGNL